MNCSNFTFANSTLAYLASANLVLAILTLSNLALANVALATSALANLAVADFGSRTLGLGNLQWETEGTLGKSWPRDPGGGHGMDPARNDKSKKPYKQSLVREYKE